MQKEILLTILISPLLFQPLFANTVEEVDKFWQESVKPQLFAANAKYKAVWGQNGEETLFGRKFCVEKLLIRAPIKLVNPNGEMSPIMIIADEVRFVDSGMIGTKSDLYLFARKIEGKCEIYSKRGRRGKDGQLGKAPKHIADVTRSGDKGANGRPAKGRERPPTKGQDGGEAPISHTGTNGYTGTSGKKGERGADVFVFCNNFSINSHLFIGTLGGAGGPGGKGSAGVKGGPHTNSGGQGGVGGSGNIHFAGAKGGLGGVGCGGEHSRAKVWTEDFDEGRAVEPLGGGGFGGHGKDGANGSRGGNITLFVTAALPPTIRLASRGGPGGRGGSGGNGGDGSKPGPGGAGGAGGMGQPSAGGRGTNGGDGGTGGAGGCACPGGQGGRGGQGGNGGKGGTVTIYKFDSTNSPQLELFDLRGGAGGSGGKGGQGGIGAPGGAGGPNGPSGDFGVKGQVLSKPFSLARLQEVFRKGQRQ